MAETNELVESIRAEIEELENKLMDYRNLLAATELVLKVNKTQALVLQQEKLTKEIKGTEQVLAFIKSKL